MQKNIEIFRLTIRSGHTINLLPIKMDTSSKNSYQFRPDN